MHRANETVSQRDKLTNSNRNKAAQRITVSAMILLAIYSATMIWIEIRSGQDYVRHYMTDIDGPVRFYAINTTLSVCLLWGAAGLFLLNLITTRDWKGRGRERLFFLSQFLLLAYLGMDDRFKFHETFGWLFGVNDVFVLGAIAAAELAALGILGNLRIRSPKTRNYLVLGGLLTGLMLIADGAFADDQFLRLSIEDLFKAWASLFLFLFSWEVYSDNLDKMLEAASRSNHAMGGKSHDSGSVKLKAV